MLNNCWRFSSLVVLLSAVAVSAATPDAPEARIGYVTGWDLEIINSTAWSEVTTSSDPGHAEGADYYYEHSAVDEDWTAIVFYLGDDEWTLKVTNEHATRILDYVAFPWEDAGKKLHSTDDVSDNISFGTFKEGQARRQEDHPNNGTGIFPALTYPGSFFAPFSISADSTHARIAWASNWPAKQVYPNMRKNGIHLMYRDDELGEDESAEYNLIVKTVTGTASSGDHPWYKAALEYRDWLRDQMTTDGTYPVEYNDWMIENQGFLNLQLENITTTDLNNGNVYTKWQTVRDDLSFVLMWGQMSDYNGSCCAQTRTLHSRYTAANSFDTGKDIYDFVDDIVAYGHHVGFYSRSLDPDETPTTTNQDWWADWLDDQRDIWGANAYYLDVLGAAYHGDPDTIVDFFGTSWGEGTSTDDLGFDGDTTDDGPDAIIEGAVDIYPSAYMISGAYGSDTSSTQTGGPRYTLEVLEANGTDSDNVIYFPRLATVVLNDRIFYSGESNSGWQMWGDFNWRNDEVGATYSESWNYWVERNSFLQGHKLDVIHEELQDYATDNPRLYDILDLRDDHHWWSRNMLYQDIDGLTNIDSRLRVRRFTDLNGENVFAVEWWDFDSGSIPSPLPTFEYDSVTYDAPEAIFGIVETAFNYDDTSPCDSDANGTPDYAELAPCLYDFDSDGAVDADDVFAVKAVQGNCSGSPSYVAAYDTDCDGCVDEDDKLRVDALVGESCN